MPEFSYARGRIEESVQFLSGEIREFQSDYANKTLNFRWQAIKMYKDKKDAVLKLIQLVLEWEKKKGGE